MSNVTSQNLKNHARFDPLYHFFVSLVFLINLIVATVYASTHRSFYTAWFVLVSLAAVFAILKLRQYPLKVQDRVIRLEERLRLQALTPTEWHTQIYRLNESQLIALRFAADDEVVELAKQALEHNLDRKQIKERIKSWRTDDWRV